MAKKTVKDGAKKEIRTYKNACDLIYLVCCALHGKTPEKEAIAAMELEDVYKLAKFHSLQSMSYAGLENYTLSDSTAELGISPELAAEWKNARSAVMRKNLMLDFEREKLIAFMEDRGIWYIPLKGIIMRKLYPKMGWRQMVDNDILFDSDHRGAVRGFMVENGYDVKMYNKGAHDIYAKEPCYNFEMHVMLYNGSYGEPALLKVYEYYKDVKSRLIKDADNKFGYHMSDEDFYVFMTTHAFKHYRFGGTGLRTFLDTYIYFDRLGDKLDRDYIGAELEKMGIAEFESGIRSLALELFSDKCVYFADKEDALDSQARELLLLHTLSGAFGTAQNNIKTRLEVISGGSGRITLKTKLRYCFERLFPSMEYYRVYAPIAYKYRILIPFVFIYRLFFGIFISRKMSLEIKLLKKE